MQKNKKQKKNNNDKQKTNKQKTVCSIAEIKKSCWGTLTLLKNFIKLNSSETHISIFYEG